MIVREGIKKSIDIEKIASHKGNLHSKDTEKNKANMINIARGIKDNTEIINTRKGI